MPKEKVVKKIDRRPRPSDRMRENVNSRWTTYTKPLLDDRGNVVAMIEETVCGNCKGEEPRDRYKRPIKSEFCPWCGAKMNRREIHRTLWNWTNACMSRKCEGDCDLCEEEGKDNAEKG